MPVANKDSFDQPYDVEGSHMTTRQENALPTEMQTSFNYPTNGKPSPLFVARATFRTGDGFGPKVMVRP